MNAILENMKTRRSIRKYQDKPVPRDVLERIAEAGTYAPTGMNKQDPIILVVTNRELRDRLSKLNARVIGNEELDPFYGAPAVMVVLADKSWRTYAKDGSLVLGNLLNAAHAEGLGSCWIDRAKEVFESEEGQTILKELGIEGEYEGIGHCILGYADGPEPEAAPRKEGYVIFAE